MIFNEAIYTPGIQPFTVSNFSSVILFIAIVFTVLPFILCTSIGVRSWGGVVGIRGSLPFVDGGDMRRPEFAPFDEDGNWVIEGFGVEPDIEVDNDPAKEYAGEDQQLNKAIEVILEQLKDTKPPIEIPAEFPDKSK